MSFVFTPSSQLTFVVTLYWQDDELQYTIGFSSYTLSHISQLLLQVPENEDDLIPMLEV